MRIIPKMHFLLHFPKIVQKNGPMPTMWAMNYERLNRTIKAPAKIITQLQEPSEIAGISKAMLLVECCSEKRSH